MCFTILSSEGSRITWDHEENVEGIKDTSKLAKANLGNLKSKRCHRKFHCRHVASVLRKKMLNQTDTLPTTSEIAIKRTTKTNQTKQTKKPKTNQPSTPIKTSKTNKKDKTKPAKKNTSILCKTLIARFQNIEMKLLKVDEKKLLESCIQQLFVLCLKEGIDESWRYLFCYCNFIVLLMI